MPAVDLGTGAIFSFPTGGTTHAQVVSAEWSDISRPSIKTTYMGTAPGGTGTSIIAYDTFIPGDMIDPGQVALEMHFDTNNCGTATSGLLGLIQGAAGTFNIQWPLSGTEGTRAVWAASGFVTGASVSTPLEDKIMANVTLKLSGAPTVTLAA